MADVTLALRSLLRSPVHTTLVVVCLAIGLTVNVIAFSVAHALIYGELPGITDRTSVVRMSMQHDAVFGAETVAGQVVAAGPLSRGDFDVFTSALPPALIDAAAEGRHSLTLRAGDHRQLINAAAVSNRYFETLGTSARLGRLLGPQDHQPGAPAVAVMSDHLWRTRFDARADILGSTVLLDDLAVTIVGVAPARFSGIQPVDVGESPASGVQVWVPLSVLHEDRAAVSLEAFGRKAPGVTSADVETALKPAGAAIAAAFPGQRTNARLVVRTYGIDPDERPVVAVMGMLLFMAVPLCVMAIALANVVNLQLARVTEHTRAIVVRLTLGASRAQAMRWLVIETSLLACAAAGAALLLTVGALRQGATLLPLDLRLNPAVITVTLALTMVVVWLSTWLPARLVMRRLSLSGTPTAPPGHVRVRHALVAAQVAISLALVLIAALSARSIAAITRTAPPDAARVQLLHLNRGPIDVLRDQLASDPQVEAFGFSSARALGSSIRYWVAGDEVAVRRNVTGAAVTPGWLRAIGAPVLAGRMYDDTEANVAVVSETMALRVADAPARAIGQSLRVQVAPDSAPVTVPIIGVIADPIREPDGRARASLFVAPSGAWTSGATVAIRQRTATPVAPLLQSLDRRLDMTPVTTLSAAVAGQAAESVSVGVAFAAIGALAAVLAFLGLAAVMMYMVQWRSRELAIRGALGATPQDLVGLVTRQAGRLVGIGAVAGMGLGVALAVAMRSQLVGVSALDPAASLSTVGGFVVIGLLAAVWPAVRAARTNPASLLR